MKAKSTSVVVAQQFAVVGLVVIVLGCTANLYNSYANVRFIYDPIDYLYYFRYVLLLASGFTFGYFFTKKSGNNNRLFAGVAYASLAISLFWFSDLLRTFIPSLFTAPYPTGKILFMSMPLLGIVATFIAAYFWQYKSNQATINRSIKVAIPVAFALYEMTSLIQGVYFISLDASLHSPSALWNLFANYLVSPLVIGVLSYFALSNVKKLSDRLLYAGLVGILYSLFILSLGEFQLDVHYKVVVISNAIATGLALIFTALFVWKIRTSHNVQ